MKNTFTLVSSDVGCELGEQIQIGDRAGVKFKATVFGTGPNKNHVILNEAELEQFAASFTGQPFLRDHERSQTARGGTILDSRLEDVNGRKVIRQTISAVKPWAVEGVKDGTIDRFSIGWAADEYICTVCSTDFRDEDEKHTIFDIGRKDRKSGKTVEVLMKGLSGSEVSAVTHPAVPGTSADGVLEQLQQLMESSASGARQSGRVGRGQNDREELMIEKLRSLLGLAADAAEPEALAALETRLSAPRPLVAGILSALGLGAEATDDEAIAAVHKLHATTVPKEQYEAVAKELGTIKAEALVRRYEDERKITPAMRDWARSLAESNPAEFERIMATFPVATPALSAPPPPSAPPAISSDEDEQRALAGVTTDEWNRAKAKVAAQRGK